ncbi:uncharacterized protein LOC131687384 [Topomyia yanbarensis]|uniref:uncharacterized protein LOC131687384 n=1 Tax=Topomyia yanbarensis TaxID=2498891 RepID=UPI00273C74C9|nr:uncharacterized protein LOC131687384 [Topomyia yanbarensis]
MIKERYAKSTADDCDVIKGGSNNNIYQFTITCHTIHWCKRAILLLKMRTIILLELFMAIISVSVVTQTELAVEHSQMFLDQLDHYGNVNILDDILKEYSHTNENWTNPELARYDLQVVAFLRQYVNKAHENAINYKGFAKSGNGVKALTNFCGPGNWSTNGEVTQNPYFTRIDQCCKSHDECPVYIVERKDYENFPGLPYKPQLFTRLRCSCDVQFFSCLRDVATFFSYAVAWIYSKVQTYCIEYEYPVTECKQQMRDVFIFFPRCVEYQVDNSTSRKWQWFNIPYLGAKQTCFPIVSYRPEILRNTYHVEENTVF